MKILIAKDQKTGRACMFRFHDCDECNKKTGVKCVLKDDKLSDRYIMNCEDNKALLKKMVKDMNVKQVQIPRFEMCMECELRKAKKPSVYEQIMQGLQEAIEYEKGREAK